MRRSSVLILLFYWIATQCMAGPGDPTIRILTAYTDEFLAIVPGHNVNSTVTLQISELNQALSDSGVHLNVAGAGIKYMQNLPADYPSFQSAFSQIRNSYPVQKARDDLDADVTIVLAYSGSTSVTYKVGPQFADEAMALIGYQNIADFGYLHEFGHLLGARHQLSGGADPIYNDTVGIGHGWYERVKLTMTNSCAHTIMAYAPAPGLNGVNCTSYRVQKFSNPLYCDNFTGFYSPTGVAYGCLPWGDGSHNNAAVMNSRVATVAGFHLSKRAPILAASWLTTILTAMGLQ